jgi:hypothetical protein
VIWLYAICDQPSRPASPEALREGALLAVFGRTAHPVDDPDALWAHERVVEELMAERTVLPMRFASTFADEAALRAFLVERHDELVALLARVRGRVEYAVRAVQPGRAPAASGREYMLTKLRTSKLDAPLAALAVQARRQPPHGWDEVLRGAYLVERDAAPEFRAAVADLQRAHPELAVLSTGPWPPYSFVGDA